MFKAPIVTAEQLAAVQGRATEPFTTFLQEMRAVAPAARQASVEIDEKLRRAVAPRI